MADDHSVIDKLEIRLNGVAKRLPGPLSITQLLKELDMSHRRLAVEVDGSIVPRSTYDEKILTSGAVVEIIAAVGGG